MTDRQAMLEAILDHPWDSVRRLIFADWLEESGAEGRRADLIRATGEVSLTPDEFHEAFPEEDRIAGLLKAEVVVGLSQKEANRLRADWLGTVPLSPVLVFVGGFLDTVHMQLSNWLRHGKYLARNHPIGWVSISDRSPFLDVVTHRHARIDRYHLWAVEEAEDPTPWRLPEKIAARLDPKPSQLRYTSPQEARLALANACLAWAHSDEE